MADDPNEDIPIGREDYCPESCRSSRSLSVGFSKIADDPNEDIPIGRDNYFSECRRRSRNTRKGHVVSKLKRYELEDKYLRLVDETNMLKKLLNCHQDKINKLTTKMMRVTANSRTCPAVLDIVDDKNKMITLELENAKLKDKISVLRNQLLSHTIAGRSSSRSRNPQARPSSGRVTCRSESSRTKIPSCHCIVGTVDDDNVGQNNLDRIEKLEAEKKKMSSRIEQLEKELSACIVTDQREKVAENVEYIRVWRQMKQLNDKLIVAQRINETLNVEINDLKRKLEETTTKNNEDITTALLGEKKRMSEIDAQLLKAKDSQLFLREKDEQIKDLMNEIKILQQHNNELIALSSKAGEVELENAELKKKVNEQLHDQQNLKTAYNAEQNNIVTLQASNEQLFGKLQELQRNINSLTVQLTSFQTQTERPETSVGTQISMKVTDKKTPTVEANQVSYDEKSTEMEKCRNCCRMFEKIMQSEEGVQVSGEPCKLTDQCVQTECAVGAVLSNKIDRGTSPMTPETEKPQKEESRSVGQILEQTSNSPLTPEKMLRLLEQAQINMPMETARFVQKDGSNIVDSNDALDVNQRHSGTENRPLRCTCRKNDQHTNTHSSTGEQSNDSTKILTVLYNILREWNGNIGLHPSFSTNKSETPKDINNNDETVTLDVERFVDRSTGTKNSNENVHRTGCSSRRTCRNIYSKLRPERLKRKIFLSANKQIRSVTFAETEDCTCIDSMSCLANSDCGQCCNDSSKLNTLNGSNDVKCETQSSTITNSVKNVVSALNDSVANYTGNGTGTIYTTRKLQKHNIEPYRPRKKRETNYSSGEDQNLQDYMKQLNKCRDILKLNHLLNESAIPVDRIAEHVDIKDSLKYSTINADQKFDTRKTVSQCSLNCPNECVDNSSFVSDSFPLLISDGEGLMELHIVCLQLSTSAKQILLRETDISNVSLFVSWDFWNQETAYTPILKCPRLNFNSSFVYRIPDLFSFFNYVLLEFVTFEVNVSREMKDSYMVARGKLSIKDILDYPQNKLHYIALVNSVLPCSLGANFGQLSLWVRLSCDVEKVEAFKTKRGLHAPPDYSQHPVEKLTNIEEPKKPDIPITNDLVVLKETTSYDQLVLAQSKEHITLYPSSTEGSDDTRVVLDEVLTGRTVHPILSEESSRRQSSAAEVFQEAPRAPVFAREKSQLISRSQETLSLEITESEEEIRDTIMPDARRSVMAEVEKTDTEKIPEESELSSITEFNTLISNNKTETMEHRDSNKSIYEVTDVFSEQKWQEYKRRSLANVFKSASGVSEEAKKIDTFSDAPREKDTIIIEIVNIILFPKCSAMLNDDIKLIYVEYSFLGYCGADMETVSVPKPKSSSQKLTYNFRKKFHVDEEKHSVQDNILRAMLTDSTNPNIKFIIVSEPLPEETDVKECIEIGMATFNIRQYALGDSEKVVSLPIICPDDSEQIGLLKIFVLGLDTIRQRLGRRKSSF